MLNDNNISSSHCLIADEGADSEFSLAKSLLILKNNSRPWTELDAQQFGEYFENAPTTRDISTPITTQRYQPTCRPLTDDKDGGKVAPPRKKRRVRDNARLETPPAHLIFKQAAAIIGDSDDFWRDIFVGMSRNIFRKGFKYFPQKHQDSSSTLALDDDNASAPGVILGRLLYRIKSSVVKDVECNITNDPENVISTVKTFMWKTCGTMSNMDRKITEMNFKKKAFELDAINKPDENAWKAVKGSRIRGLLIRNFVFKSLKYPDRLLSMAYPTPGDDVNATASQLFDRTSLDFTRTMHRIAMDMIYTIKLGIASGYLCENKHVVLKNRAIDKIRDLVFDFRRCDFFIQMSNDETTTTTKKGHRKREDAVVAKTKKRKNRPEQNSEADEEEVTASSVRFVGGNHYKCSCKNNSALTATSDLASTSTVFGFNSAIYNVYLQERQDETPREDVTLLISPGLLTCEYCRLTPSNVLNIASRLCLKIGTLADLNVRRRLLSANAFDESKETTRDDYISRHCISLGITGPAIATAAAYFYVFSSSSNQGQDDDLPPRFTSYKKAAKLPKRQKSFAEKKSNAIAKLNDFFCTTATASSAIVTLAIPKIEYSILPIGISKHLSLCAFEKIIDDIGDGNVLASALFCSLSKSAFTTTLQEILDNVKAWQNKSTAVSADVDCAEKRAIAIANDLQRKNIKTMFTNMASAAEEEFDIVDSYLLNSGKIESSNGHRLGANNIKRWRKFTECNLKALTKRKCAKASPDDYFKQELGLLPFFSNFQNWATPLLV
jgi:hypothetical protein